MFKIHRQRLSQTQNSEAENKPNMGAFFSWLGERRL